MGFGKFLCAVGAVIAAPVVLPAAAAAGVAAAAAAGTAAVAAAGTAATAVGTAATAGAAVVTAAATTAGTAVAGTAAGAAVSSGLAAVGSSVGTAAGAVGLSSVAAITGTTAGEISLGAITTSAAVGATSAASGAGKMKEASQMKKEAEKKYNNAKNHFEEIEAGTNEKLNDLGRLKLEIWNSFDRFKIAFEQIKNLEGWGDLQIEERVEFGDAELADIKILSLTAKDLMKGGIGSIAGGELVGVALTSGITSVATASTGTAIASLSGAAATNASLAALGGGSLASGGLGMAGGAVVANALVFAPAMAIGGIFLHGKGKKNLNLAKESKEESDALVKNMQEAEKELYKLQELVNKMDISLRAYWKYYCEWVGKLENLVRRETDFRKYTYEERRIVFVSGQITSILKNLSLQQLLEDEKDSQLQKVRDKEIDVYLKDTSERWKKIQ